MGAGCKEAVEIGKGGRLTFAKIGEHDAVLDHDRIALLADPLTESAAFGLGRGFQALAIDIEQPAMEQAAQAAVFEAAKGEVGAPMWTVAVE